MTTFPGVRFAHDPIQRSNCSLQSDRIRRAVPQLSSRHLFPILVLATLLTAFGWNCARATEASANKIKAMLANLSEIKIQFGTNEVKQTDTKDDLKIIAAWRDWAIAPSGHTTYMVMKHVHHLDSLDADAWTVVPFETGILKYTDAFTDDPHLIEDAVTSVRFFRATLSKIPSIVMFVAKRHIVYGYPSPAHARITIYQLVTDADNDSKTKNESAFSKIAEFDTHSMYCNANAALNKELSIPLPVDYLGLSLPPDYLGSNLRGDGCGP